MKIKAGENRNLKRTSSPSRSPTWRAGRGRRAAGRGWRIAVWACHRRLAPGGWAYSGITEQRGEGFDAATLAYGALNSESDPNDVSPRMMGDELEYHCEDFETGGETAQGDQRSAQVTKIRDLCDKGPRHKNLVNLVWIPATAAAVLFTSFAVYKGYIAPGKMTPSERAAARKKRSKRRVTVMPAIGPNLVGAGLELQF